MTNKEFKKKIKPLITEMESEGDKYFLVHFSLIDDYYKGMDNLDFGDCLILIDELQNRQHP